MLKCNRKSIIGIASGLIISSLTLTGCGNKEKPGDLLPEDSDPAVVVVDDFDDEELEYEEENEIIENQEAEEDEITPMPTQESKEEQVKSYDLIINSKKDIPDSLDFINDYKNLKTLNIKVSKDVYVNDELFSTIDGKKLQKLKEVSIDNPYMNFNENYSFIKKIPYLENLNLIDLFEIDPNFLENLKNVGNLQIKPNEFSCINYCNLDSLETLTFDKNTDPYSLAIYLSDDDISNLRRQGVNVRMVKKSYNKLKEADKFLNKIIDKLEIENYFDKEKNIDKVANYILDNYSPVNEYSDESSFYEGGYLKEALNSKNIICGNYAALATALLNRIGIKSTILTSDNNKWNLLMLTEEDVDNIDSINNCYQNLDLATADYMEEYGFSEQNNKRWNFTDPLTDNNQPLNFPKYIDEDSMESLKYDIPYTYKKTK